MPSSTTMPPTNTRGCADGWPVTRAGPSTYPDLGVLLNAVEAFFAKLTRQRLKRGVFQSAVTCNSPSTASWQIPTPIQNPSSGPPTPNASSPLSNVGSKCWS